MKYCFNLDSEMREIEKNKMKTMFLKNTVIEYVNSKIISQFGYNLDKADELHLAFNVSMQTNDSKNMQPSSTFIVNLTEYSIEQKHYTAVKVPRMTQLKNPATYSDSKASIRERLKILFTGKADSSKDILDIQEHTKRIQ